MEKQNEERLIYLKDLVFVVLRRWRVVLAVAMIGALLLGGWQGISGLRAARAPVDPLVYQQMLEDYEQKKSVQELHLQTARENIEQQQEYLENSVLIKLNPYSYYEASLHLYVETDRPQLSGTETLQNVNADVLHAYEAMMVSGPVVQVLAEALDIEDRYVLEVFSAVPNNAASTLALSIKLPAEDAAQEILELLENRLDAAAEQINRDVVPHKAIITAKSVNERLDMELSVVQQDAYTRLADLKTALADIEAENALLIPPVTQSGSLKSAIKTAIIWAVIGAALGAFATAFVLWVAHIGSDKVYAARNLTNLTGVKVISSLSCGKKNPIDRLVCHLEGRDRQNREINVAAMDISCRAKGAKRLLITGSGEIADRAALVQAVAAVMPDVQVEDQGNILQDVQAIKALAQCDAAVLVEACDVSCYTDIRQALSVIADNGKLLLGCVLFNG